jgi:hypothetical protein
MVSGLVYDAPTLASSRLLSAKFAYVDVRFLKGAGKTV